MAEDEDPGGDTTIALRALLCEPMRGEGVLRNPPWRGG